MKLTSEQLDKIKDIPFRYDLHYKLWDWLAKHPWHCKSHYFAQFPDELKYAGDAVCHACDYAIKVRAILNTKCRHPRCDFCPFKLDSRTSDLCLNGKYDDWFNGTVDKRAEYAKQIRDMKLNPMYNFKDSV